jgi:2'-5' RNA ligase
MERVRTFTAIALNDAVRKNLVSLQRELSAGGAKVKWVEEENLHLTMKFLGDVDMSLIGEIGQVLQDSVAGFEPFTFTVRGAGAFPGTSSARIVWVGATGPIETLAKIYNHLNENLARLGVARENRRYVPHITLGRVKSPSKGRELTELIKKNSEKVFGDVDAGEILLMMSELSSSGPKYSVLSTAQMGAGKSQKSE